MTYTKNYVDYKVSVLLNELGVKSYDFSNAENNEKVDAVKEQIFALINSLPKGSKTYEEVKQILIEELAKGVKK